jgi:hypothetical protein
MDPLTWLSLIGSTPTAPMTGAFPPNMAPTNRIMPDAVVAPSADIAAFPTLGASLQGAQFSDPQSVAGSVGGNVAALPGGGGAASGGTIPSSATPTAGTGGGSGGSALANALKGISAPKPPDVQSVRTPPPPALAPIKGGEFLSMLTSLGIGPQELMRMRMGGR